MLKIKSIALAFLSITASLSYAALPTDGIYPQKPGPHIPLLGTQTYDVLVDLVPGTNNQLNAFGTGSPVQGMIRNTAAVTLTGSAVPAPPPGGLPLAQGYQYLVAGYVYPAHSLASCTQNPTAACTPSRERIGNWLCSGTAIADPNQSSWPTGKAMSAATMMFNITQKINNQPYKGIFTSTFFEGNPFADAGAKFSAPINNGSGSFRYVNEMTVEPLGFVGGPTDMSQGLQVAFRVTVKKSLL